MSTNCEWINTKWCIYTMESYLVIKAISSDTCYNMNGPWIACALGASQKGPCMIPFMKTVPTRPIYRDKTPPSDGQRLGRWGDVGVPATGYEFLCRVMEMLYNWLWWWLHNPVTALKTIALHTVMRELYVYELYSSKAVKKWLKSLLKASSPTLRGLFSRWY